MARSNFKLDGFKDLTKNLNELNQDLSQKAGTQAVRKAGQFVAKAIRAKAPRGDGDTTRTYKTAAGTQTTDYGHLADARNIAARKGRAKDRHNITFIISTGRAFWGRFLEFGTRKMAARPFFKPAMDAAMPEALEIMKVELGKAINKAWSGGFNKRR